MRTSVRLRLARYGVANRPWYHIVAIPTYKARNAKPLEKLGEYDPVPRIRDAGAAPRKLVEWDADRVKHWLDRGARPSETVLSLLVRGGLLPKDNKFRKRTHSPPRPVSPAAVAPRTPEPAAEGAVPAKGA